MPQLQQEDAPAVWDVEDSQIEQDGQNLQPKFGSVSVSET